MRQQENRTFFGGTGTYTGPAPAVPIVDAAGRIAFLRRVYAWMFAGVVATVFGAGIAVKSGFAEAMLSWGILSQLLLMFAWIGGAYLVQRVRHVPSWNV